MISLTPSALNALAQRCRPKTSTALTLSERFYSAYGLIFTAFLENTPITPNQITFCMLVMGVTGSVLFAQHSAIVQALGVLLLHTSIAIDKTDGDIAWLRKSKSVRGKFLDRVTHRLVSSTLFIGLIVRQSMEGATGWNLAPGLVGWLFFELSSNVSHYVIRGRYVGGVFQPAAKAQSGDNAAPTGLTPAGALRFFFTDAGLYTAALACLLLNIPLQLPLIYGAAAPVFFAIRFWRIWRTLD